MIIPIYRGDDTNFNDSLFLSTRITAPFDLTGFSAQIDLNNGNIVKKYELDENGGFDFVLSADESLTLPFGTIYGTVALIDPEGRKQTVANKLEFNVSTDLKAHSGYMLYLNITGVMADTDSGSGDTGDNESGSTGGETPEDDSTLQAEAILTELQTKYAQGKIALAKVLTNKGEPTEAKEEIIDMVDKVNNLNVESNVTNIKAKVWESTVQGSDTGSYLGVVRMNGNLDFILFHSGMLYYIPDGKYTTFAETVSAASFSLDTGLEISSSNHQYFTMYVSSNNSYLLIRGTSGTDLRLYKINSDSFEVVNDNIVTTTNTEESTNYSKNVAVDDVGRVIAFSQGSNLILYNIETGAEYTFSSSSTSNGAYHFINGKKVYVIVYATYGRLVNSVDTWAYEVAEDGTITATLESSHTPWTTSTTGTILTCGDSVYYIALTTAATPNPTLGVYDIGSVHFCEIENVDIGSRSATFKNFPIGNITTSGNSSDSFAMAHSAQLKDFGDTVEITFGNMKSEDKFIYNKAKKTVTANNEIYITHPDEYGLRYRGILSSKGSYMRISNNRNAPHQGAANQALYTNLLDGEKIIAKKVTRLDGTVVYYTPGHALQYADAKAGYYDAETPVTPEAEEAE